MGYKILTFDTKLFGYPVAELSGRGIERTLQQMSAKRIKLAYWFIDSGDARANAVALKNNGRLVDEKITYTAHCEALKNHNSNIYSYTGTSASQELTDLALQSGIYSRFLTDRNFTHHEYKKLYTAWIINSVNRKRAFDVLVYRGTDLTIKGLVTLESEGIGLLAVDKTCRGKGIGTLLIQDACRVLYGHGRTNLNVATQKRNIVACRFYESLGFKVLKAENIYHFWL